MDDSTRTACTEITVRIRDDANFANCSASDGVSSCSSLPIRARFTIWC